MFKRVFFTFLFLISTNFFSQTTAVSPFSFTGFGEKSFKGNSSYKRIIKASAFCSEKDIFLNENYKIIRSQKISIIPPIGGG